jgi:hypothetical protein
MNKEKGKKQKLIWIIDFINLDIDELGTGDFLKLLAEITGKLRNLPFFILPSRPESREELSDQLHKVGPGGIIVDKIVEKRGLENELLFYEDTPKIRELIKSIQGRLRNFLEEIYKAKDKPWDNFLHIFQNHFNVMVGNGGITVFQVPGPFALEYELAQLIFDCSPPSDKAIEGFAELVRSLKVLKRCQAPACTKFFWQAHKKEKNFCSNKCAWRAYSKFKRDEEKKDRAKRRKEANA